MSQLPCAIVVGGVCTVASCMGRELAPHVKKHGSKLVPGSLKTGNGHSNVDGAMKVAASGMQGMEKNSKQNISHFEDNQTVNRKAINCSSTIKFNLKPCGEILPWM